MDSIWAIALAALLGGCLFFASLRSWRFGFYGLLVYLPFAGLVSLRTGQSAIGLLAKDIVFVIPTYISFFVIHRFPIARLRIPGVIVVSMLGLAALVLMQSLNPNVPNVLVALIGIKVWLMYLPLTFVAAAAIRDKADLIFFLRVFCVAAIGPLSAGFLQRFGVELVGAEVLAQALYGSGANLDNLGLFAGVNEIEGLYRIVGTFSANGQYGVYVIIVILLSLLLSMIEEDAKWRWFAVILTWIAIAASFMSGAKGATVFVPLVLGTTLLLNRNASMLIGAAILLPIIYLSVLTISGVDVAAMLELVWNYGSYNIQDFGANQIMDTFYSYPLGLGTGMTTGGARYAFTDEAVAYQSIYFFEVYYAKTVAELSLVGIIPVAILMFTPFLRSAKAAWSARKKDARSIASTLCGFFVFVMVISYKAWPLDVDPTNVLFWVLSGIFYKVSFLTATQAFENNIAPARRFTLANAIP